jgi:hypothetical protein
MSHSYEFIRYKDGKSDGIDQESLLAVLERYNFEGVNLVEGANEIPTPIDNETEDSPIGGYLLVTVEFDRVTCVSISRPRYQEHFRLFSFDLVFGLGLVMFSDNGEVLYSRSDVSKHLPADFPSQFGFVDLVVTSVAQMP